MKYKDKFFYESCMECLNPSSECDDILKYKCYIEWADKKIAGYKTVIRECKIETVKLGKKLLEEL